MIFFHSPVNEDSIAVLHEEGGKITETRSFGKSRSYEDDCSLLVQNQTTNKRVKTYVEHQKL